MSESSQQGPVAGLQGFVAFPGQFASAPDDLRQVVKVLHRPTVRKGEVGLEFSTDAAVIDFSEVDSDRLNFEALIADCDLLKQAASNSPEGLRALVREMQRGTEEGVKRALEISSDLGLTEDAAVGSGGGFIFLVAIAAAALLAGGCGGALKEKASSATTTPKPPPKPPQ